MVDSLGASLFELRPHTSLSLFKWTEYLKSKIRIPKSKICFFFIRCSMLDVRCSTFISFFSLIRLAVFLAEGRRSSETWLLADLTTGARCRIQKDAYGI